jgi:DNA-binding transcriptional MerR regulator
VSVYPFSGDEAIVAERTLRTGEVARLAGVNVQTLRYYERQKLLPRPERTSGGHRAYPQDAVTLVRTIKGAQRLGFRLGEIRALLAAGHRRAGLRSRAVAKMAEVDAEIEDLAAVRTALAAVVAAGCDDLANCTSADCPAGPGSPLTVSRPDPSSSAARPPSRRAASS